MIWLWFPCSNLVNSMFYRLDSLCDTFLQDSGMPDEYASGNAAAGPDPWQVGPDPWQVGPDPWQRSDPWQSSSMSLSYDESTKPTSPLGNSGLTSVANRCQKFRRIWTRLDKFLFLSSKGPDFVHVSRCFPCFVMCACIHVVSLVVGGGGD